VWFTACSTYKQIGLDEVADYNRVRVTLIDGDRETLLDPVVADNAVSGREDKARRHRDPVVPVVIPLDQVDNLEAVNRNAGGTAAAIVVGVVAGFALIGGIAVAASGGIME
jgi:hypothetical protein